MDPFLINTETFQLTQLDFLIRLAVAIGIGAIIGLEREFSALHEKVGSFAGIRTFVLVTLLGFSAAMLYQIMGIWVYVGILLTVFIITGLSYWITASKGEIGATTEFTALISFILGTLAFLGYIEISLMITVIVVVLLSTKIQLHNFIGKITAEELYDFISFVIIALLIFPFLPDKTYGPYNIINPREIGWVVLLTSGVGFAGYILMRVLGTGKGILLSGIVGGLVSSTAVTWVFSKRSSENKLLSPACGVAIMASSCVMVIRMLVWIFIYNKSFFHDVYIEMLMIFIACVLITVFMYFKQGGNKNIEADVRQNKPLDLQGTLAFGVIYSVVLLAISYTNNKLGTEGLVMSSVFAGMSDIDAVTITLSKLAHSIEHSKVATALLFATMSNTFIKLIIVLYAGSAALKKLLSFGYGLIIVAILIAILVF